MTENKRIVLNVLVTYGRSLLSVALGLFSGRWILEALGDVDFGLLGVVGGLTAFVTFFNGMLSGSISRFYAYSIGRAKASIAYESGLEECRKWFNTAIFIHTIVPIVLIAIGYPIGEWVVRCYLNIPADRVSSCVNVWRFTCVSCFVGMINVPFSAMYGAKQYIAELAVYGLARTIVNFVFIYYMVSHPGDWLERYALWTCLIAIAPQLLICARALMVFPECKFNLSYMWSPDCLRQLGGYSFWQAFGKVGYMIRTQGISIAINKFFGARINAASSFASVVEGQAISLSTSMYGAFQPAIAQACGAGEMNRAFKLTGITNRFCVVTVLFFALPLFLECGYVMNLWLINPPPYVTELCCMFILAYLFDRASIGYVILLNAVGKVKRCQTYESVGLCVGLPLLILLAILGVGPYAIGLTSISSFGILALLRVYCAKQELGLAILSWLKGLVLPVGITMIIALAIGILCCHICAEGTFMRLVTATISTDLSLAAMCWFFIFDNDEKTYVRDKALQLMRSLRIFQG